MDELSITMNETLHSAMKLKFHFRLYVTGNSPMSVRARANLEAVCREHLPHRHQIEVIDILENPLRLFQDQIAVTPALVRVAPTPPLKVVGDLSDLTQVLMLLNI